MAKLGSSINRDFRISQRGAGEVRAPFKLRMVLVAESAYFIGSRVLAFRSGNGQ